jgi:tRNA pseudouridine13 synthase
MRLASLEQLWHGDLAMKHDNGACFKVPDPAVEQPRAERLEISPTAPLYGHKVKLATGQAGILEESLLDKESLRLTDFKLSAGLAMAGERRPIRVPLQDVATEAQGADLILAFTLPRGSFATSVLREVMKTEFSLQA